MTEIFKDRTVITLPAISHIDDFKKYPNALVELLKLRNEDYGDRPSEIYHVLDLLQNMMDVSYAEHKEPPKSA